MNLKKNQKEKEIFSRTLRCGGKTYDFHIFEATTGSWYLRIKEKSQSAKRKGEFDIIVYAEYLPQFLDCIDAVRRAIECESTGTFTA